MLDTIHALRAPGRTPVRNVGPRERSAERAAADLRAATRYYERHVVAWYALGRVIEARAARDAVAGCRRTLAAEIHDISNGHPR